MPGMCVVEDQEVQTVYEIMYMIKQSLRLKILSHHFRNYLKSFNNGNPAETVLRPAMLNVG